MAEKMKQMYYLVDAAQPVARFEVETEDAPPQLIKWGYNLYQRQGDKYQLVVPTIIDIPTAIKGGDHPILINKEQLIELQMCLYENRDGADQ
jgi:hypothetical protein